MLNRTTIYVYLVVVAAALVLCLWRLWRHRSWRSRVSYGGLSVILIGAVAVGSYFFWYTHRPLPEPELRMLYPGATYMRLVRDEPRPHIVHAVYINLNTDGLSFLVTPPVDDNLSLLPARTTSDFLAEYGLQIAINGDFYAPWHDRGPQDYYPHIDEPIESRGLAASQGNLYTRGYVSSRAYNSLYISADNVVTFTPPDTPIYNAISGWQFLVRDAQVMSFQRLTDSYARSPQPRTSFGLDASGDTLILVVVDGRQPYYSEGLSLREMAALMIELGANDALNMDGGGSSTLVIMGEDGKPQVLNSPIHSRIPGRERPIANHLGIYIMD